MRGLFRMAPVLGALLGLSTPVQAVQLTVLEWEGYTSVFEKEFEAHAHAQGQDIDLVLTRKPDGSAYHITKSDDIFETLGAKAADVVTPTHSYYQGQQSRLTGMLHPIDTARLSNYADIFAILRDAPFFKGPSGGRYGLPLIGGSYALAYNAAKVKAPASWHVLLEPQAKGTYAITGDQYEANIYQLALMSGVAPTNVYDIGRYTPEQVKKVNENLRTLVANAAGFWAGIPDATMMAGLSYVTDYWFGVTAASKAGQSWRLADPVEGATVWLDTIAIAAHVADDPEKLEAAYLLLDYAIGPDAQTIYAREFGNVIVSDKALERLPANLRDTQPGPAFFKPDRFWHPLNSRTRNSFRIMWEEAVAAAKR